MATPTNSPLKKLFRFSSPNISATVLGLTIALSSTSAQATEADTSAVKLSNAEICFIQARESMFDQRYDREALQHCNRALRFDRLSAVNQARTYINRGVLLKNMALLRYAAGDFRRAQNTLRPSGELQVNLGNLAYLRGNFDQAIDKYSRALAMGISAPYKAYLNRGLTQEQLGNIEAARQDYLLALQDNPELELAREQLMGMLQPQGLANNNQQTRERRQQLLDSFLQQSVAAL